jgi:hypothetical protein
MGAYNFAFPLGENRLCRFLKRTRWKYLDLKGKKRPSYRRKTCFVILNGSVSPDSYISGLPTDLGKLFRGKSALNSDALNGNEGLITANHLTFLETRNWVEVLLLL